MVTAAQHPEQHREQAAPPVRTPVVAAVAVVTTAVTAIAVVSPHPEVMTHVLTPCADVERPPPANRVLLQRTLRNV